MAAPLKVLIVEDSENDALLMVRALKRGGYEPSWVRVDTPEALEAALQDQPWDVVLADYKMPRFTGLDALKQLRERDADLPFILVSGNIGEELAATCVKAGAQDYVLKDNLPRLTATISREVMDAEERRARKRAEAAVRDLSRFPDENPAPVLRVALDGRILYANPPARELLAVWGCAESTHVGEEWTQWVSDVFTSGQRQEVEVEVGETVYSLILVPIPEGGYVNFYGRDISERKAFEVERNRLVAALRERVKELTALERTSRIIRSTDDPAETVLESFVNELPPAWQYPEIAAARVTVGDLRVMTPSFTESPWMQKVAFDTSYGARVVLEMAYLEERKAEVEGPFLAEERSLLNALAEQLRWYLERRHDEQEIKRLNRSLATIRECHQVIVHAEQEETLLSEVCGVLIDKGGYRLAWVGFAEHGPGRTVRSVAQAGFDAGSVAAARATWEDTEQGRGPVGLAIRTGQPQTIRDVQTDPTFAPWRDEALMQGYTSVMALPLLFNDEVSGVLCLYAAAGDAFDPEEEQLLIGLAWDLGYAVTAIRTQVDRDSTLQALQQSQDRLSLVLEGADLGIWDWNIQTGELIFNDRWASMLGYQQGELRPSIETWESLVHPADLPGAKAAIQAHLEGRTAFFETEHRLRSKNREWIWLLKRGKVVARDDQGRPLRAAGTHLDITERKAMEAHAQRIEQLATLGQLLSGIAHELKNPLFVLTGRLQLFKEKMLHREYEGLGTDFSKIEEASQRMVSIAQRFLSFARPHLPHQELCSVQTVLEGTLDFISNELMKQHIQVVRRFSPGSASVLADPRQLHEVFLNLILNAVQAMAEANGKGTLTLTIDQTSAGVEVRIQDDGPGIAPEHRDKIFEPFFSTKPAEKGTGLGLWTVRSAVMSMNGAISYETEVGKGSTFVVRLPVSSRGSKGDP